MYIIPPICYRNKGGGSLSWFFVGLAGGLAVWESGRLYRSGDGVEFQMRSGVHQLVEKRQADEPTQGLAKGDECR